MGLRFNTPFCFIGEKTNFSFPASNHVKVAMLERQNDGKKTILVYTQSNSIKRPIDENLKLSSTAVSRLYAFHVYDRNCLQFI